MPFTQDSEWNTHIRLWRKAHERMLSIGALVWPFDGKIWDWGIITAVTDTTVTIGGKTWQTSPKRWVSWNGTGLGGELEVAPANYDLVIDGRLSPYVRPEPWEIIQTHIIDQPSGNTLTVGRKLSNWSNSGQIIPESSGPGTISDLVGRRAYIKKRNQWNYGDRWPQWHNPHERGYGQIGTADSTHITDLSKNWKTDELVGKEIVFFVAGSSDIRRCAITANTATQYTFTNSAGGTPEGNYTIITAGQGPVDPNRPHYSPFQVWNWGYSPFFWTRHPKTDSLPSSYSNRPYGPIALPKEYAINWLEKISGVCQPVTKYALGIDLWTAIDHPCMTKDESWAPFLFRTLRGLQEFCLDACSNFVEYQSHNGAKSIPNYVPATLLYRAGINAFTGTTGSLVSPSPDVSNRIIVTGVTLPVGVSYPCQVHFAIRDVIDDIGRYNNRVLGTDPDSGKRQYGTLYQDSGAVILEFNDANSPFHGEFSTLNENKPVIFSLGFTRFSPWVIWHLYDRTIFVPDNDEDGPVVPPTEEFPGYYLSRSRSMEYAEHTQEGQIYDGTQTFVNDRVGWYVGDWYDQPDSIIGRVPYSDPIPAGIQYVSNLFERTPEDINAYQQSRIGTATESGTTTQISDSTKSWGSLVRTEAGHATSGSTTTLQDSTKAASSRWAGSGGRWLDFIVKIQAPDFVWHKRQITSFSPSTQMLGFAALPFTVTVGTAYEIEELEIKDRWEGRSVTITRPGSWTHTSKISRNNRQTLILATPAPAAIQIGDRFEIEEYLPGCMLKWNGTEHIAPTGNDPRTGAAWRENPNLNHPSTHKQYGLAMRLDYVGGTNLQVRDEIDACLTAMREFKLTTVWKHDPVDVDGINNFPNYRIGEAICGWPTWCCTPWDSVHNTTGSAVTEADGRWDLATPTESDNAPLCWSHGAATTNSSGSATTYDAGYESRFAYGSFNFGYAMPFNFSAAYYAHAIIPGKIPVVAGHVDPIGDTSLHPTPIDSVGNDLYDIGPGTDNNAPNKRNFNANGTILSWRQFINWYSFSGSAGTINHVTDDPLGGLGPVKPVLVSQPVTPPSTTTQDYLGYIVNKAVTVISPVYAF